MSSVKSNRLPPGWESKMEPKTGKNFFVNHFTHNVTLEDPRIKQITEEMEVFPKSNNKRERSSHRQFPMMGAQVMQSTTQPNLLESLTRLRTMFPTVPETHIKALLIKYHGREAVVISALQVEKHPVTTPGPYTPPPARITQQQRSPHSPLARRPPPKPHSPKMKLRYLKSVFPVVEETLLLDTLCNSDNNVTFATQRLIRMGYDKRDTPTPPRVCLKKDSSKKETNETPKREPSSQANKVCTDQEKKAMKERLCAKYKEIPDRVISLAIDSADYNEKTAETILSFTLKEKETKNKVEESREDDGVLENKDIVIGEGETEVDAANPCGCSHLTQPTPPSNPPPTKSSVTVKLNNDKNVSQERYKSPSTIRPKGPDPNLPKGPNNTLLLAYRDDYVPWVGAKRGLPKGPDRGLVEGPRGAVGPDLSLRIGPCRPLVRGPVYSRQLISPDSSRGN